MQTFFRADGKLLSAFYEINLKTGVRVGETALILCLYN
jgi:hypothetical protein